MEKLNFLAAAKLPLGIACLALVLVFGLLKNKTKLPPLWHWGGMGLAWLAVLGGLGLAFFQEQIDADTAKLKAASARAGTGQSVKLGNIGASASVSVDQKASAASAAQGLEAGSVGQGAKVEIKQSQ